MSENDLKVEANLWKVFDIYKSAGVFDESLILENISYCLLLYHMREATISNVMFRYPLDKVGSLAQKFIRSEIKSIEFQNLLSDLTPSEIPFVGRLPQNQNIPKFDNQLNENNQHEVVWLLWETFQNISNLGQWFNEYLIPRLATLSKGGRYATPRHLINFMAKVVGLKSNDTLVDFACGTGGMLVANGKLKKAIGVEISPNMARLAFTNLILHGQEHTLYLGNAFDNSLHLSSDEQFDVVLMNPPWGVKLDPYLLDYLFNQSWFFSEFRGKSETLFTALAYQRLKPGGRMAIMVPSGLLFSTGRGETSLRKYLVSENALQAVVSLPRAIENVSTHIFVATKPKNPQKQTRNLWFYRPRFDGFMGAKNPEPNELNDLPLVQIACNAKVDGSDVNVIPLIQAEKLLGYQISTNGDSDFIVNPMRKDLLVEVIQNNEVVEYIHTKGEEVYRGKNSRIPLPKITSKGNSLEGKYVIKTMLEFISDEAPAFSALFEPGKGEIRKGVQNKSRFGIATKDEVKATGLLLNKKFQVASSPFPIVLDKSVGDEKPTYFMLFDGDEKEPVGLLVVLYDGLNGIRLHGSDSELFLCDWNKSRGEALFYMPSRSIFLWNNSLSFKEDPNKATVQSEIFRSDKLRRGVMFTVHSQILGIYVSRQEILNTKNAELQPEKYWVEKHQDIVTRSAAQILGDIKKNQNQLTSTLDRLLSISEVQPVAGTELPPQLSLIAPSQELLQGIQQGIWEIVQKQTEQAANYLTPKPFQADDVHSELNENISVMDVQRALELFERMGLIVSVSYEGAPYYRLPEERDVIKGGIE